MKCPNCQRQVKVESNFCSFCGCDLSDHDENKIKCGSCGNFIEGKSNYCLYCGFEITQINEKNFKMGLVNPDFKSSDEYNLLINFDNDDALKIIDKKLNKSHSPELLNLKAKIYLTMGDYENAMSYFKQSSKLDNNFLNDLIFMYCRIGDLESANKLYNTSLNKNEILDFLINERFESEFDGFSIDLMYYPYAIYLKTNYHIKCAIDDLKFNDQSGAIKNLEISIRYLEEFYYIEKGYELNKNYIVLNYNYILNLLDYFENYNLITDNKIINQYLIVIVEIIYKYFDFDEINNQIKFLAKLNIIYKNIAKILLSNNLNDDAITFFKWATFCDFNDGESWFFIADLTDNSLYYNKSLFCFEKQLEFSQDNDIKLFKAISLYKLNRKKEAYDYLKSSLSLEMNDTELEQYFFDILKGVK